MNKLYVFLMLLFTALIAVAFFLPWASVDSQAVGKISKFISGKEQVVIQTISGFKVPILANSSDARLMISIIKLFNPGITDADKKSYLIWGVPGLAVIILLVSLFLGKNKWVNLAYGLIGILIFAVAVYKIKTTDLDKIILNVNIESGLWLTFWGYLGIGLLGFLRFAQLLSKSKK